MKEKWKSLRDLLLWLKEEENRESLAYLVQKLIHLIKHCRFRKIKGYWKLGFSDPYREGQVLQHLAFLYPMYQDQLEIIPYFDRDIQEGDILLKGHIRLIHVLIFGIQMLKKKEIRELLLGGRHGRK